MKREAIELEMKRIDEVSRKLIKQAKHEGKLLDLDRLLNRTAAFTKGYAQGREDAARVIDECVRQLADKLKLCPPEVADELSFATAQMKILSHTIRTWEEILAKPRQK